MDMGRKYNWMTDDPLENNKNLIGCHSINKLWCAIDCMLQIAYSLYLKSTQDIKI